MPEVLRKRAGISIYNVGIDPILMEDARMDKPIQEFATFQSQSKLFHAINNRMNTIALGLSILEQDTDNNVRSIADSLQDEFRDLQHLIAELRKPPGN